MPEINNITTRVNRWDPRIRLVAAKFELIKTAVNVTIMLSVTDIVSR